MCTEMENTAHNQEKKSTVKRNSTMAEIIELGAEDFQKATIPQKF